jgi:hypothetical protein
MRVDARLYSGEALPEKGDHNNREIPWVRQILNRTAVAAATPPNR